MKRPAFQFYPNDWRGNANLRRCSEAARGAWIDVLCLLHDSDEYGVLRWPLVDIAQAAGLPIKLLQELARKNVLKGADGYAAPYTWAPTHAGKVGEEVTLVATDAGPCWYCSRFVRDEHLRQKRGANSRFGDDNPPPKATPKVAPIPPIGDHEGYGASASSSSSKSKSYQPTVDCRPADAADPPDPCPHQEIVALYHAALPTNPAVKVWNGTRASNLRARWREDSKRQSLDYWQRFFAHVAASPFLTGRVVDRNGRPFLPGLDWLVLPTNFAKVIEGRYHDAR